MKRIEKIVVATLMAWFMLLFLYGLVVFTDGPYKPCHSVEGYCGKTGKSHTKAEYEAHNLWQKIYFGTAPFLLVAGVLVNLRRKANKSIEPTR
jgi:hypothetical protein